MLVSRNFIKSLNKSLYNNFKYQSVRNLYFGGEDVIISKDDNINNDNVNNDKLNNDNSENNKDKESEIIYFYEI